MFFIILSFVGCDKDPITFPNKGDLESIVLSEFTEENNICISVTDNKEIKNIIDSIKFNSKKTSKDSVGEYPINVDCCIGLEFLYSTDKGEVGYAVYIYKVKEKYYFEVPYSAIWKIEQESYENIDLLLKHKINSTKINFV